MYQRYHFYVPTRTVFGWGALRDLHKLQMPGKKAMLVLSNGKSAEQSGALDIVLEQCKLLKVTTSLFRQVEANPTKSTVMHGAEFAKKNKCDFVIALGGGSVMDASKAMAFMATNPGDVWDYMVGGTGKGMPMRREPLPLICITTTAGTGSEADQWGVITNEKTNEKMGFGGYDQLFPVLSIVDPQCMVSVPPRLTAFQGFDTLFHAVECYISKAANMLSDVYALAAIENTAKYLARAVQNGTDQEARERMAFANNLAGVVMTISSTTAEHSLEHAMSAYHSNLPHGAGLIMISKAFYEFFIERHACDARFVDMAKVMGICSATKPQEFIEALMRLQEQCGVSNCKMSDYGILQTEFAQLSYNAKQTMGGLFQANPCELTHNDCIEIFQKSYR